MELLLPRKEKKWAEWKKLIKEKQKYFPLLKKKFHKAFLFSFHCDHMEVKIKSTVKGGTTKALILFPFIEFHPSVIRIFRGFSLRAYS